MCRVLILMTSGQSSSRGPLLGVLFLVLAAGLVFTAVHFLKTDDPAPHEFAAQGGDTGTEKGPASAVRDPVNPPPRENEIEGAFQVRCCGLGGPTDPIAGALVRATPMLGVKPLTDKVIEMRTDAKGMVVFDGLRHDNYEVLAHPEGYYPLQVNGVHQGDKIEFSFSDPIRFRGVVLSAEDRSPVKNAVISCFSGLDADLVSDKLRTAIREGKDPATVDDYDRNWPRYTMELRTDKDGSFEFAGVPSGFTLVIEIFHQFYDPLSDRVLLGTDQDFEREYLLLKRTSLFGKVIDDVTDKPMANVTVKATEGGIPLQVIDTFGGSGADIYECVTDAEGNYRFDNIARGDQHLHVEVPGYALYAESFTATQTEPMEKLIRLRKGATISGRVINAANQPVPGALVLWRYPEAELFAGISAGEENAVATAADGTFQVLDAPVGRSFNLIVSHPDYMKGRNDSVVLEAGESLTDLEILLSRGGAISGVVQTSSREPIPGATITAQPVQPAGPAMGKVISKADGTYLIENTKPGVYKLVCEAAGYCQAENNNVRDMATDVSFFLVREAVLAGRFIDATDGSPVKKAQVRYKRAGADRKWEIQTAFFQDEDGDFQIKGISTGTWEFEVTAEGYADFRLESVAFAEGEQKTDQVLRLSRGAAAVGRVKSTEGKPIASAIVRFENLEKFSSSDREYYRLQTKSNANGEYHMANLRPGRYQCWAAHPKYARMEPVEVTILDGPETLFDIEVSAPGKLRLFVRDENGNPLPGARAFLFPGNSPVESARPVTGPGGVQGLQLPDNSRDAFGQEDDADSISRQYVEVPESGELLWRRKEPGEYTLWVQANGYYKYSSKLSLPAGRMTLHEASLVVVAPGEDPNAKQPKPEARGGKGKNAGEEGAEGKKGKKKNKGEGKPEGDGSGDG